MTTYLIETYSINVRKDGTGRAKRERFVVVAEDRAQARKKAEQAAGAGATSKTLAVIDDIRRVSCI